MKDAINVLIVGIGGYGNTYVNELIENPCGYQYKIIGAIDPLPDSCNNISTIRGMGIPVLDSMQAFFTGYPETRVDLTIISSPIQYHCEQTCLALSKGSNVLCEKPMAAVLQDAYKMIEARDKSGKFLAIGYQWSFEQAILNLKKDIMSGRFGRAKRLKTLVLWPRSRRYYARNPWAGKIRDESGRWVLDSIANNAAAHYLHNMFYILGNKIDRSAFPAQIKAQLHRANDIENFDTSIIQAFTEEGTEILFYASHTVPDSVGPDFCYEFEKGTVAYSQNEHSRGIITASFNDGTVKFYGGPHESDMCKLRTCLDAAASEGGSRIPSIPCGPEAALPHTVCINRIQESVPLITGFPAELIRFNEKESLVWVEGLSEALSQCYQKGSFPEESGLLP